MSARTRILVVDDDRAVRTAVQVNLTKAGFQVTLASTAAEALEALHEAEYDLMLTDVRMPGETGIELLARSRAAWPDLAVVVMTGFGSVDGAVQAMQSGAQDYVIKPIAKGELLLVLDRALERRALRAEVASLRRAVTDRYGFERIIGRSPKMNALFQEIAAVADTSATVLLEGPTGVGKELIANALHQRSRRSKSPFIRVNCAAIPESLLESELFGHERGAFTGAIRQHLGKFEQSDGGTLLLDEIGELPLHTQVKLLRVLQNGELQRVGGSATVRVDVRLIAATNRQLDVEVAQGRFREDLYYRLNVVRIRVPALAERREDIPLLVTHFLNDYARRNGRAAPRLHARVLDQLVRYDWPGNVRQLEHTIERAVILCPSDVIEQLEMPTTTTNTTPVAPASAPPPPDDDLSLPDALARFERHRIIAALKAEGGVQARAAKRLGVSRSNLNYRIQKLGIQLKEVSYE